MHHDGDDEAWTLLAGYRAGRQGARDDRSRAAEWRLGWRLGRERHEQEIDRVLNRVLERGRAREKRSARATAQWLHHQLGRPDKPPRKTRARLSGATP